MDSAALWKWSWKINSRFGDSDRAERKRLHGGDQADVRAANGTLGAGHPHGGLGSCATAILLRAVVTGASAARDTDFLGHRLVARHLLFNGLHHATLTTFRVARGVDFLGDDVIAAGFHLASFRAISGASALIGISEHGAAGGKAEGNSNE